MALNHTVAEAEAGQKLLAWLIRRLDAPQALLHRWIRTGQVRVNSGRASPFERLAAGDVVRLPPFAETISEAARTTKLPPQRVSENETELPPIAAQTPEMFIFCKPAGLPTHPGTGHSDSLVSRLHALVPQEGFRPTPAHRLDKDTSGLLVVARTYASLRRLQELFGNGEESRCGKEYLTWVVGEWPTHEATLLRDHLRKATTACGEKMISGASGKEAALTALCLERRNGFSLLHIRLHTGRTHQIRAQLAARGFPVAGDRKYGARKGPENLLLHAARLVLPEAIYEALPPWTGPWRVKTLPPPLRAAAE